MSILITSDPATVRREIDEKVEGVIKFMMLRTLSHLTASPDEGGTPVKTGFAAASWILSVGTPSTKVAGSPADVDYGPQEQGQAEVHAYKLHQGAVFLTNSTEYIHILNFGSSPQARAGFVEAASTRAVNETSKHFSTL